MFEQNPRVVFDCNVFVQGIANRMSPARKALRLFFDGAVSLLLVKRSCAKSVMSWAARKSVARCRALMTA